jgi:hypothetical protein
MRRKTTCFAPVHLIEVSLQQNVTRGIRTKELLHVVSDGVSVRIFYNSGEAEYCIGDIIKFQRLKIRGFSLTVRMNVDRRRGAGGGCLVW